MTCSSLALMFRNKGSKKHSHIKQLKPKLPLQFRSNTLPRCGMQGLFKDPAFPTDDLLLMVEFCKHFGVWHRWQQPEGVPDGAGVKKKKKKTPSEAHCTTLMWANGNRKDLTAFWHGIGCRTHGFLSGALYPDEEEMRRRRWLRHAGLMSAACWRWRNLD